MKKYIFVGDEKVIARWINEFPDLINLVADFIELSRMFEIEDLSLLSETHQYLTNADNIIVMASNNIAACNVIKEQFGDSCVLIKIRDFVTQQLIGSKLMPSRIRIDASTICQLNCKSCYMRLNNSGKVGSGYLSFYNFKRLIDNEPYIKEVELSNSGEIFLNPDLVNIIEYAYTNGIELTALNGVNFNSVTDQQLEALVRYHFHELMISIDGASQETYSQYRINGNFDIVIENIKKLNEYKKQFNSCYPRIIWQYIIMEHNERDIPLAKIKAKELGIPIWFKLTWDKNYQPKHREMLLQETGLKSLTRSEYLKTMKKVYLGAEVCSQMFLCPQINWDGKLLGCCEIFMDDYQVNVFEKGLRKALQTRKFIEAKKSLLHKPFIELLSRENPCFKCTKRIEMNNIHEELLPFENILN